MRRPDILVLAGALLCFAGLAGPALADTRGEAISRAEHCNILPEGRAWLDCYYGAAQPTRQVLGLTPAPQAVQYQQVYLQPPTAAARPRDNRGLVLDRAAHCNILPEGGAWLECFYGAAQPSRQALGLAPAPQALQFQQVYGQPLVQGGAQGAALAAGVPEPEEDRGFFDVFNSPKVPPEQFGLKGAKPGPGLNVDRIMDRVTNVQSTKTGFVVTLANGQVWRQVDNVPVVWTRGASYSVVITHGAFNSFNLRRQEGRQLQVDAYKVRRIR